MAALSVKNVALAATLLCSGFSGGWCASISHEGLLVSRRSQLVADEGKAPFMARLPRGGKTQGELSFVEAQKPIRIVRHGSGGGTLPGKRADADVIQEPCGSTLKVDSSSDKWQVCPTDCPFFAQNRNDDDFCTFSCVKEAQCAQMHSKTPIGDSELGVCRSCVVEGCKTCDNSVSADRCAKCQWGYKLMPDGSCFFELIPVWVSWLGYALLAVLAIVVLWLVDFAILRPVYNREGLDHALECRDAQKLKQPKDGTGKRQPWPIHTNLCKELVAGPGMMLHFNFQVALIVWALFVAAVWMGLAFFVDEALWILGTRAFGTPRMNCILVAWGYETQQRLMWTKVFFLWVVYIGSFLGAIGYGIYQLRAFQDIDYKNKTMKDYVVMVTGLPSISGNENVEGCLKSAIEKATQQNLVGVSVAWDFADVEERVGSELHHELQAAELEKERLSGKSRPGEPEVNAVRAQMMKVELNIFGPGAEDDDAKTEDQEEAPSSARTAPIGQILESMHTSTRAFAVFETEDARDEATRTGSFEFEVPGQAGVKQTCTMEAILGEPDTVKWESFGHDSGKEQATKLLAGFGIIGLACALWGVVFYGPYAYYVMTFNYENGRQPGFVVGFSFSMIVVVGNVIMYEVCGRISDWIGFRFRDEREACYMILYTIACMFNVALDFVTTYSTAEMVMESLGFRTYFGVPLADLPTFTAKFETYGMQRSLAENTYGYAFPSTYLIPFLIEPFPTIVMPLLIGKWIVGSHAGLQGADAEDWLAMAPMDMGRYADLLLNTILGILIFYFPGGYTWILFLGMAGSHVYIYAFDQFKVLREIPACKYASFDVEWWCQAMFAPIIGIMVSCLVFKSNCEPGYHCTSGMPLIALCGLGWLVHVVIHISVLQFVVPKFSLAPPKDDPNEGKRYQSVAEAEPCSWFSANPVHCLRSKYHFKDNVPCGFFKVGKEWMMKANPAIGCFYEEKHSDDAA